MNISQHFGYQICIYSNTQSCLPKMTDNKHLKVETRTHLNKRILIKKSGDYVK
ncbi:MAG: hypothetical protein RLZZ118_984 [Bacteroidota bacterium]|jgi:hypothetical protein